MAIVYLVQHGEKEARPGDPGLTARGRRQATRTGQWLNGLGVTGLWTSPLRRARETADAIAAVTGLTVHPDERLRERLNWDGTLSFESFLTLWARTARDRDLVPERGQSSRQAGALLASFLTDLATHPGPAAAVTHGGLTVELLRNLLADEALPPALLESGIPACAVTALDGHTPVIIASASHLR